MFDNMGLELSHKEFRLVNTGVTIKLLTAPAVKDTS